MYLTIRAVLIALIAAGCGAGTSATALPTATLTAEPTEAPTPSPEPEMTFAVLDACAILDQKAAQKVAQTPLGTSQPGNPLSPSCSYDGPVTGPTAKVSIYTGDAAKKTYDIDVELHHEFTPVPDVGDEAYIEPNAIFFRKGTMWVVIELVRLNDPKENEQPLIDAAKAVAAALP
jgi:hypothetical protein